MILCFSFLAGLSAAGLMVPAIAHGPLLNGSTCLLFAPFDMAATKGCREGRGDPLQFTRTGKRGDLTDFECLFVPDELL